jgi:hypothetical protein
VAGLPLEKLFHPLSEAMNLAQLTIPNSKGKWEISLHLTNQSLRFQG